MRFGAWTILTVLALVLVAAAPAPCEEQPTGRKEAMKESRDQTAPTTQAEPKEPHGHSYREKINLIAREPLRKIVPPTVPPSGERSEKGPKQIRPLIARHPVKAMDEQRGLRHRKNHVYDIARGPIRQPEKGKD